MLATNHVVPNSHTSLNETHSTSITTTNTSLTTSSNQDISTIIQSLTNSMIPNTSSNSIVPSSTHNALMTSKPYDFNDELKQWNMKPYEYKAQHAIPAQTYCCVDHLIDILNPDSENPHLFDTDLNKILTEHCKRIYPQDRSHFSSLVNN